MKKLMQTSDTFVRQLPFSYFSLPIYLDCFGYTFERNKESLIVTQDSVYPHEFPSVFLPQKPENWSCCSVTFATQEDLQRVRQQGVPILIERSIGSEFFYQTEPFVYPTGSFGKKVRAFQKKYVYKLSSSCDRQTIETFHARWLAQQKTMSQTFIEDEIFFRFCLDHLDTYPIKQVYVEIDDRLVGFAWGIEHPISQCDDYIGGWVGLHLKVDYAFQGLSRFLHHERAKLFSDRPEFTLGTGVFDPGIESYKRELDPCREVGYSYMLTGDVGSSK